MRDKGGEMKKRKPMTIPQMRKMLKALYPDSNVKVEKSLFLGKPGGYMISFRGGTGKDIVDNVSLMFGTR